VRDRLDWCLGQRLFAVRTKKDRLFGRYLYYVLRSPGVLHDLHSRATGTTVQGIRQPELRRVRIPVPPMATQRAVAESLGALDDKIALDRRMSETLEAMARTLFTSWFVAFDRSGGVAPADWETVALDEAVEVLAGGTPRTSVPEYWGGPIPWFSVKDAPDPGDVWVLQTERTVTQAGLDNSAAQVLPAGTTIMSARGTVGKLALVGVPMAMNQSCFGLKSRLGADAYAYFTARTLVAELQRRAHGSVFDTINRETLSGFSMLMPPIEVITKFEATVRPTLERIKLSLRESRSLVDIRDALLPKLISGELRVPDAERIAVEAGA
jgi:type I restriction enzyme S subunit